MLVRLFGKNFRSFKGDFELSMVAADLKRNEDRDRGVIEVPISGMAEPLRLLRAVGIYGANASGKSTVLAAGRALRWLGTDSSESSKPETKISVYQPFSLDAESRVAPVELGCDVVHGKSLLRYEITYQSHEIQRETLTLLDEGHKEKLIERQPSGEVLGSLMTRGKVNRLYVEEMQPNVAVLAKLAQHGPRKGKESVLSYYSSLRRATRFIDYSDATVTLDPDQLLPSKRFIDFGKLLHGNRFSDDADYREWIMRHLIQPADVGIQDVHARRENFNRSERLEFYLMNHFAKSAYGSDTTMPDGKVVVSFVHGDSLDQAIDFSDESTGTKKLFNIANEWWSLANESVTLLADELGASLHPRLLDRLIRAVNDAPAERQSQLIFATHDTGLLESKDGEPPALRRDQVYFTKKDACGASELYSLAEFKDDARPVHNIRKRYLSGLYGAIPSVEKLSL